MASAYAPSHPTLAATPGNEPVIARLTWSASASAVRYAISVATTPTGPFRVVGETDGQTLSYSFTDGIGGLPYYFRVTAINEAGERSAPAGQPTGPVTSSWVTEPHKVADRSTNKCASCHVLHGALATPLMRTEVATGAPSQKATCLSCHGGRIATAPDLAGGSRDSFGLASGHTLDTSASAGDLTSSCASCHDPHASSAGDPMIRREKINHTSVSSSGNAWCLACHDDRDSWYPSAYPPSSAPLTDAKGYPVAGVWLGETIWGGATNAHRLVPETTQTVAPGKTVRRGAGDCLYCHAAHRGANTYDGLVGTFRPTTPSSLAADKAQGDYAALCFTCHGGSTPSGFATAPVDIKRFVTGGGDTAGHSIVTSGGLLPVGSPLPCYQCHNPHGSKRGNESMISDALGKSLATTGSAEAVRTFCFTCHTTADAARGWDSAASTYTAVAPGIKVVGIPRTGGVLKLPSFSGHGQNDTTSCYGCHGSAYGDGGNNVHRPSMGGYDAATHTAAPLSQVVMISGSSFGPVVCADCHDTVLGAEHEKATSSSTGRGCSTCHPTPKDTLTPSWDKSCAQGGCHTAGSSAPMHAAIDAGHAPVAGQTCYASGCHPAAQTASLAETHRNATAVLGGQTRTGCQVCHWNGTPASRECASCHADRVDGTHGAATAHTFTSASDYSNTTVTGCTNSGSGCHDAETTYSSFAAYHPNSGCTSGACHASPSKATYSGNHECASCHDGNFINAPDVVSITGASPNGHYNETTHTANGLADQVKGSASGTVSAVCSDCHNPTAAAGINGLYNQHQGLPAPYGATTCADCHNNNLAVTTVIRTKWATRRCDECHNAATMPAAEQHGSTAPVVTGSSSVACADSGCHGTWNLHEIHGGTPGGSVTTCALSGCHDYAAQGTKPTSTTCGVGGACHTDKVDGSHGAARAHTFTSASNYNNTTVSGCTNSGVGCHNSETTYESFTAYHPGSGCRTGACHTSPSKATYAGNHECVSCHDGTFVNAPKTDPLHGPAGAGHYGETSHTAMWLDTRVTAGGTASATCADCHSPTNLGTSDVRQLYNQHQGLPGPYVDTTCEDCHNKNVMVTSVITSKWQSRRCDECHNSTVLPLLEQHGTTSPVVVPTAVGTYQSMSCDAAGCHTQGDIHAIHQNAATCALSGCHDFNLQAKLPIGASCGVGYACHNTAEPHTRLNAAHDASAQQLAQPGSRTTAASASNVLAENFGTTTTWPSTWTRSSTTLVTNQTGSARTGAAAQIGVNATRTQYDFYRDVDLTGFTSAELGFWYQVNVSSTADFLIVEYSTNGGANYAQLFRRDTDALTWAQAATMTVPAGGSVRLRFRGTFDAAGEYGRVDDILLVGKKAASTTPLPANSTAQVSCQDNPNGTECHSVGDVRTLHAATPNTCTNCHKAGGPTNNCQTAGCHSTQFVNVDVHNSANHATGQVSTAAGQPFAGTGVSATTCTGCHDDSISLEHSALTAYAATPCSVCHRKSADSGAPTGVTAANTQQTIAKTAGSALCTDCHKTVTASAPHVQRAGTTSTLGSTQFDPTWSGHRIYDTMYGSRAGGTGSTFNGQTTSISWSLPTAGAWLKTNWTSPTQGVRCDDCHGSVTGASGPHGASMVVNIASGYDDSYSTGALTLNGSSMSNTTNLCAKCHVTNLGYNFVHTTGNHSGQPCTACHTKTPHAWKRPRLIGYTTDPAPYRTTQVTSIRVKSHTLNDWVVTDCGAGCTTTHPTITGSALWP